jgi:hypothetical protein
MKVRASLKKIAALALSVAAIAVFVATLTSCENANYDELESIVGVEKVAQLREFSWSHRHVAYGREASYANGTCVVRCSNQASSLKLYSDDTSVRDTVSYTVENRFTVVASAVTVNDLDAVVGKTVAVASDGTATVSGQEIVKISWKSAALTADVMLNGTNYRDSIPACRVKAQLLTVNAANAATIRFYEDGAPADYAEVTLPISINGAQPEQPETPSEPAAETPAMSTTHKAWTSASLSGSSIYVNCSNTASFKYSVNTANNEDVAYTCQNTFSWSGLTVEVSDLSSVVGKTYNFSNGTLTINGVSARCSFASAKVSSDVYHRDTNYKDQITPCKAKAISITFNSAKSATILLGEDANDNVAVSVPVSITETEKVITVTDIVRNFIHSAYRSNASVSNNTISIICDNVANFYKKYSDNTQSDATNVAYTVTNKFSLSMPTFVGSTPTGTYSFNNGTATVSGQNVVVTFLSRTTASIVFENKDYKSEAPVCEVTAKSVTFKDGEADVVFSDGKENITVTVPVTVISAEEISGQILKIWITDSYKGRVYDSSYLHILTADGKVYSRVSTAKAGSTFTVKTLTASQLAVAKNQALAYYWYNDQWVLGYVSPIKYTESSKTKYILQYFDFSGALANNLGKAEATLNGADFEYPIKEATYSSTTGLWSISGLYFIGK